MLVEGTIVQYKNILWIVKGIYDGYSDCVIATPRYSIDRKCKIKDLRKAMKIAEKLHAIVYHERIKRRVPCVPLNRIELILNPFESYAKEMLDDKALHFVSLIERLSGARVGITGSYLAKTIIRDLTPRDIDLVILDSDNLHNRVYQVLRVLRLENLTRPCTINDIEIDKSIDRKSLDYLLRIRIIEGLYRDKPYSIRVVDINALNRWSRLKVLRRTSFTGKIVIAYAVRPYSMPYTYIVRNTRTDRYILLMSHRMRFSEIPINTVLKLKKCCIEYYEEDIYAISLDNESCRVSILR